jgi:hypothetical protein
MTSTNNPYRASMTAGTAARVAANGTERACPSWHAEARAAERLSRRTITSRGSNFAPAMLPLFRPVELDDDLAALRRDGERPGTVAAVGAEGLEPPTCSL